MLFSSDREQAAPRLVHLDHVKTWGGRRGFPSAGSQAVTSSAPFANPHACQPKEREDPQCGPLRSRQVPRPSRDTFRADWPRPPNLAAQHEHRATLGSNSYHASSGCRTPGPVSVIRRDAMIASRASSVIRPRFGRRMVALARGLPVTSHDRSAGSAFTANSLLCRRLEERSLGPGGLLRSAGCDVEAADQHVTIILR